MNTQQEIILDYFHRRPNYGKPEHYTHHMRMENTSCGDAVEIYLTVENGRVAAAHFTGEGCSIAIAAAAMLTEELVGKTVAEVEAITTEDMIKLVGIELTPTRQKCADLSLEAAKSALAGK